MDDERVVILSCELIEGLQYAGHHFTQRHAVLVEVLGVATGYVMS